MIYTVKNPAKSAMKIWSKNSMLSSAKALWAQHYQQKRSAHWNHDIHFLHRDQLWIEEGVNQILDGTYNPQIIRRFYFSDGICDSISYRDRVFLRLIYDQLKSTFSQVINPHCYHVQGPNGVRKASAKIKTVLREKKPRYFIRADIKSYFASIAHDVLIEDIKAHYNDPRLIKLLTQIIKTPIQTQNGYINPDKGIPLRNPLSGFFSGLYLKEVDDCFTACDVNYFRYQDDLLILCPSLRSFKRCKTRLMHILARKRLSLAIKKTKTGRIERGFHFLGIDYLGTQTLDKTNSLGGKKSPPMCLRSIFYPSDEVEPRKSDITGILQILPHGRTLRRAREQVQAMVTDGVSHLKIRAYLSLWASWWHSAKPDWSTKQLLTAWLTLCWDVHLERTVQDEHPLVTGNRLIRFPLRGRI